MELVEGVDLEELVRVRERLSFDMLRCIARDVLSGLRYLHARGVLHRDLSPSNVLVSVAGVAKVSDFGVAKFVTADGLQSQSIHGKPAYMAPELGVGQSVDSRADLFAFAASMYHLLAGVAPLGETMPEIMARHIEWRIDALPASVPEDLRAVVTGLLRRAPSERTPQTAGEALAMLAEPAEPDAVVAGLGAIVGELYARKLQRWQRHQSAQAKMAEGEEYIEAESVLEGFADIVHSRGEADEERHGTEVVGDDSWRFMESQTVSAADDAIGAAKAEKANGAQTTANRPRLALAMLLAVVVVIALAICGDVRLGSDQTPSIAWQLVRPPAPGDETMYMSVEEHARQDTSERGEERGEEPTPAPNPEPTPTSDEDRRAEVPAPAPMPAPREERHAEEPRQPVPVVVMVTPRPSPADPTAPTRPPATDSPSPHRSPRASAEAQTAAPRPSEPAEEPSESEGPPWFSDITVAYASEHP